MIVKLNESDLRKIIKAEVRHARQDALLEERASVLAEEILQEGFFDNVVGAVKATGAALGAGVKALAGPLAAAAKTAAAAAAQAAQNVATATAQLKDKAKQAAVEAAKTSMKASVDAVIKKTLTDSIKNLMSAGMTSQEAQAFAASILQSIDITKSAEGVAAPAISAVPQPKAAAPAAAAPATK